MAGLELALDVLRRMQGDLRHIKNTQSEDAPLGHIEFGAGKQSVAQPNSHLR